MTETLLFTDSHGMRTVMEKIQDAFPNVQLFSMQREPFIASFPVGVNLGAINEQTWCEWAMNNGVFQYCETLVLLSLDPPEWMRLFFQAATLKEKAKKLLADNQ